MASAALTHVPPPPWSDGIPECLPSSPLVPRDLSSAWTLASPQQHQRALVAIAAVLRRLYEQQPAACPVPPALWMPTGRLDFAHDAVCLEFPASYALFHVRRRGDPAADAAPGGGVTSPLSAGGDDDATAFVFGHPSGLNYKTINDFLPHVEWLVQDATHDHALCRCVLCPHYLQTRNRPGAAALALQRTLEEPLAGASAAKSASGSGRGRASGSRSKSGAGAASAAGLHEPRSRREASHLRHPYPPSATGAGGAGLPPSSGSPMAMPAPLASSGYNAAPPLHHVAHHAPAWHGHGSPHPHPHPHNSALPPPSHHHDAMRHGALPHPSSGDGRRPHPGDDGLGHAAAMGHPSAMGRWHHAPSPDTSAQSTPRRHPSDAGHEGGGHRHGRGAGLPRGPTGGGPHGPVPHAYPLLSGPPGYPPPVDAAGHPLDRETDAAHYKRRYKRLKLDYVREEVEHRSVQARLEQIRNETTLLQLETVILAREYQAWSAKHGQDPLAIVRGRGGRAAAVASGTGEIGGLQEPRYRRMQAALDASDYDQNDLFVLSTDSSSDDDGVGGSKRGAKRSRTLVPGLTYPATAPLASPSGGGGGGGAQLGPDGAESLLETASGAAAPVASPSGKRARARRSAGGAAGSTAGTGRRGGRQRKPKTERDPNEPTYPANAFMLFSDLMRDDIKAERDRVVLEDPAAALAAGSEAGLMNVTKTLGKRWRMLSADERDHYFALWRDKVSAYKIALRDYRASKGVAAEADADVDADAEADPDVDADPEADPEAELDADAEAKTADPFEADAEIDADADGDGEVDGDVDGGTMEIEDEEDEEDEVATATGGAATPEAETVAPLHTTTTTSTRIAPGVVASAAAPAGDDEATTPAAEDGADDLEDDMDELDPSSPHSPRGADAEFD